MKIPLLGVLLGNITKDIAKPSILSNTAPDRIMKYLSAICVGTERPLLRYVVCPRLRPRQIGPNHASAERSLAPGEDHTRFVIH